jgi:hypothetical protein
MGHKLFVLPPTERYIVLGVILLIWLLVRGSQLFFSRNKMNTPAGSPQNYGIAGGAICPKCHRPFALSLFMLKLGIGTRFTRCPHCGKWSFVQRQGLAELRAAEAAESTDAQPALPMHEKSEAGKAQTLLDDSRFTDKL